MNYILEAFRNTIIDMYMINLRCNGLINESDVNILKKNLYNLDPNDIDMDNWSYCFLQLIAEYKLYK